MQTRESLASRWSHWTFQNATGSHNLIVRSTFSQCEIEEFLTEREIPWRDLEENPEHPETHYIMIDLAEAE